ncbi:hypothetical protein GW17_00021467 [Ensete ventricosum]|nr:hypothetical protein GW17_00021467 [Ensete ventricosum]RZR97848.1 hypothetical protein BHM03_00027114 [Ensete ventricosum]
MRPKLVLFGDSITEESFGEGGWGAALAHHFSRKVSTTATASLSWSIASGFVLGRAMEGVCPDGVAPPEAVAVFFGANDASLPDRCSGFQHVPLPEYQSNLRAICAYLRVYLVKITRSTCLDLPKNTIGFSAGLILKVINLEDRCHASCDFRDGLHFTASGNSVLFDEVVKKLGDEGLSLEALPVDLPYLGDMDPNDPLKSFCD